MKSVLQNTYADSGAKIFRWAKLLAVTGMSQLLVQALGFVCGIIIIRMLSTHEYGLYVVANTAVGTMSVLADGGISTGVMSIGGKVWKDKVALGEVMSTGMDLRRKFAAGSLVVAVPLMIFLLSQHESNWIMIALIAFATIILFLTALTSALLQVPAKLLQDIVPLQKNLVKYNVFRLLASGLGLVFFPFAFIAIIATAVPQFWSNINLRRISSHYADWHQKPKREIREVILSFVKKLLPGSAYYCISGQLSIWLISFFGSTPSVAQVGALTRLTMVLSIGSVLINTLIVPRFARLINDRSVLLGYFLKIQMLLLVMTAIVLSVSWIFSDQILWLLGHRYANLNHELLLCVVGGCLNLAVGINYILNSSRGWLFHPLIGISIGIGGIVAGVSIVDVSTLRGILIFNIFTGVVGLFVHPLYGFLKIRSLKQQVV